MQFCGECGSMMHAAGDVWVCRACENEAPRDPRAEAAMATHERQQDDGDPAVADATRPTETVREACPAEDCDGDEADYEMIPKPGGSYEVRLFTCLACGHRWRG